MSEKAVEVDCGAGGFLLAADRLSCSTLLLKLVSGCAVKSPDGPEFYAFWLSKEDSDDRPPLRSCSLYLWCTHPSLPHNPTPPNAPQNQTCSTDFLPPGIAAVLLWPTPVSAASFQGPDSSFLHVTSVVEGFVPRKKKQKTQLIINTLLLAYMWHQESDTHICIHCKFNCFEMGTVRQIYFS